METERDKSLSEYCGYLRAEAAMVDSEEGTDCTTRACLLRGAAEEIERQREHIKMDAGLYIKSLNTIVDLEQRLAAAEAERIWTCGCGIVNGVNLATCRVCGRKEGEQC